MATKKKASIKSDPLPVSGSRVQGYVVNTSAKGCFLKLSSHVTGRVLIKDLSDEFIANPSAGTVPFSSLIIRTLTSRSIPSWKAC
jgi:transcriptional accessory protein Tex/SPT6